MSGLELGVVEVELDKGAQEEVHLATDVEDGERVSVIGVDESGQLVDPDLAVMIQVVEVEVDGGLDATLDAGASDAERDRRTHSDLCTEEGLGSVRPGLGIKVIDEESVDQVEGVVRGEEL